LGSELIGVIFAHENARILAFVAIDASYPRDESATFARHSANHFFSCYLKLCSQATILEGWTKEEIRILDGLFNGS